MATFAELRRFGLALPDAIEHPHMGQPSLRVCGKMFALWWEPSKTTIMKLEREHQMMLFEVRPKVFAPCKVGTGMWSYVDISKLTGAELNALVAEAWSQVVPKKLRGAAISTSAIAPQRSRRSRPAGPKDIEFSPSFPSPRRRR